MFNVYYFITSMLDYRISGIEHAQLKRLALFQKHKIPAQILTMNYSTIQHQNMQTYKLRDFELINLFDYFQNATNYRGKRTTLEDIQIPRATQMRSENNIYKFFNQDHLIMRVEMWQEHYIHQITFYDRLDNPFQIDIYDERGFLSQRQILGFDNQVAQRLYYDTSGNLVLKAAYTAGAKKENFFQLVDYKGADYFFDSKQALDTFFFDELNRKTKEPATFIVDRNFIVEAAIFNMQTAARRFFYTHNIVVADPNAPMTSKPYASMESYLANQTKVTGLLSPTHRQLADIKKRWHPQFAQYQIPVGSISDRQLTTTPIPMTERQPFKIINVARIHEQKRLEDTIAVFQKIHEQVPAATLDLYGYVNDTAIDKRLHQQVEQLNLTAAVTFHNYTLDMASIYDTTQLFLSTSRYEGYGLAIMEALAHGVPVLSYDINYGPNEIIRHGTDGYLFAQQDISGMANQAIQLLKNPKLLQELSTNAYQGRPQFSAAKVWQAWQPIITNQNGGQ